MADGDAESDAAPATPPEPPDEGDDGGPDAVDDRADRDAVDIDDRAGEDAVDAEAVAEAYDFEDFGPADMARMSREEWEAAFDPDAWITGAELIDRLEDDLRSRIADREVFARLERYEDPPRLLAYADDSYAMVYPDGSLEGRGTVRRDVEPTIALCSMPEYDVPTPPADAGLPEPDSIPDEGSTLGHTLVQVIAGVHLLAGLVLVGAAVFAALTSGGGLVSFVAGLGFLVVGLILFLVVANARLASTFRAEAYRDRLRGVGLAEGERPEFLPPPPGESAEDGADGGAPDAGEPSPTDGESESSAERQS